MESVESSCGHLSTERRGCIDKRAHHLSQLIQPEEQSRVTRDFREAAGIIQQHRTATSECFKDRKAEAFIGRWEHKAKGIMVQIEEF